MWTCAGLIMALINHAEHGQETRIECWHVIQWGLEFLLKPSPEAEIWPNRSERLCIQWYRFPDLSIHTAAATTEWWQNYHARANFGTHENDHGFFLSFSFFLFFRFSKFGFNFIYFSIHRLCYSFSSIYRIYELMFHQYLWPVLEHNDLHHASNKIHQHIFALPRMKSQICVQLGQLGGSTVDTELHLPTL